MPTETLHRHFQLPGQKRLVYVHLLHKDTAIYSAGEKVGSGGRSMFCENYTYERGVASR